MRLLIGKLLSTLQAQFLHACSDRREIIGGAGSGHVSSVRLSSRYPTVAGAASFGGGLT
jgi:hypothetical protein